MSSGFDLDYRKSGKKKNGDKLIVSKNKDQSSKNWGRKKIVGKKSSKCS